MPDAVSTFLENLETWILALAASAWIYPALFGFATIDGFFPPIPSESVVITLAVSAHATGEPNLLLVLLVAAAGAWTGDQIAFSIGRAIGTDRVRFLRSARGRTAVAWAERALAHRGASFILAARYIPVGRVAVNMTAGAVGYPRRRFMAFSGIAAVTWALYSVLIGLVAAQWLGHEPLLAMVVGVVLGIAAGFAIDRVLMMRARRRGELPRAESAATPEPEDADEASAPERTPAESDAGPATGAPSSEATGTTASGRPGAAPRAS
ncbi:membrane protein DedA with SNARE-associated domain [Cellulosimicrobium cellulans]|uniref:DedA family protein n=1 Tax=Cellulosimicrobium cellulans TaxID=1710 RepID=UPI00195D0624|nr:DedA family protein [Cellulosimicrobium cellulans]MBM7818972.1 membrane protein DedA with SNARE-associated domain [Cellulosimicrobium cellulans]